MQKKVPMESYVKANRICGKYGVEALNSMMIGLPGETRETVKASVDFLRNARDVRQANFAIAIPYPGTEFHEMTIGGQHGIELMSDDFSEYRRYGSAVTTVGELTPNDLIELQNDAFVSVYSAPWRWKTYGREIWDSRSGPDAHSGGQAVGKKAFSTNQAVSDTPGSALIVGATSTRIAGQKSLLAPSRMHQIITAIMSRVT